MIRAVYRFVSKFIFEVSELMNYLLRMLIFEDFKDYFKAMKDPNICISKKLVILGNGPSLRGVIENWETIDVLKNADLLVVNDFCCNYSFVKIKPKYYAISDAGFFYNSSTYIEQGRRIFLSLNDSVSWPMFLYVPYFIWKIIDWKTKISNSNVTVIPFHTKLYCGWLRNWFFKHGLGNGEYGTVVINGIYAGLTLGYKELYLFGVEHSFINTLFVNENNQLCNVNAHFHENRPVLKPIVYSCKDDAGKEIAYTVSQYLQCMSTLFYGHEIMLEYANYCSAKIYNCTPNSMIDAYERYCIHCCL